MPNTQGQIPFFLQNVLSTPAGSLPKQAQWVLAFEGNPDSVSSPIPVQAITNGLGYEPDGWDVQQAIDVALVKDFQTNIGCVFAQAVQLPGESTTVTPEGIQANGYLRTTVGSGRDTYGAMQVVFLETNLSFVDAVIRPWVIATSHLGLIARSGPLNYRCDMSVYKLGVYREGVPPYILAKYTFKGACPVSVTGDEYNYAPVSRGVERTTTFVYNYYTYDVMPSQNLALL